MRSFRILVRMKIRLSNGSIAMHLCELLTVTQGKHFGGNVSFKTVAIDSRTLVKGALFIAIRGRHFDGHDFCVQAQAAGAVALIVEQHLPKIILPQLVVEDTTKALAAISSYHRRTLNPLVLAVTGSCGKTTTKQMVAAILFEAGNALASEGNFNNQIGLPLSLFQLNTQHDYAVFELGADHLGEIARHAAWVQPEVAAITVIEPAHVAGFGSVENIARAKAEIYEALPAHGIAVAPQDSPYFREWSTLRKDLCWITFGLNDTADVFATEISYDATGKTRFVLWVGSEARKIAVRRYLDRNPAFSQTAPFESRSVNLPFTGLHNVRNATTAAAMALAAGISLDHIVRGLEKASNEGGRLNIIQLNNGARIIDDTYNANPGSVRAAIDTLEALSKQNPNQRLMLILGDMLELGSDAVRYHVEIATYAKAKGIHEFYAIGRFSDEMKNAFGPEAKAFVSKNELIQAIQKKLNPDVICLVKGSRGLKMEEIVQALLAQQQDQTHHE